MLSFRPHPDGRAARAAAAGPCLFQAKPAKNGNLSAKLLAVARPPRSLIAKEHMIDDLSQVQTHLSRSPQDPLLLAPRFSQRKPSGKSIIAVSCISATCEIVCGNSTLGSTADPRTWLSWTPRPQYLLAISDVSSPRFQTATRRISSIFATINGSLAFSHRGRVLRDTEQEKRIYQAFTIMQCTNRVQAR